VPGRSERRSPAPRRCPSWSCHPLQSVGVTRSSGVLVAAPAMRLPKLRYAVFLHRPRRTREVSEHPLVRLQPPAGSCRVALPASTGASHGVSSPPAPSASRLHLEVPRSRLAHVHGFHRLRGLASAAPTRACFIPGALLGFSRKGFPSSLPPAARHRRPTTPSPFTSRDGLGRAPADPFHRVLPRDLPSVGDGALARPSLLRFSCAVSFKTARAALQSLLHRR
jgi:hypothetical protein